jgi:hypothetical protein
MRSYTLLINEAELMARSPEGVYDWFKDYGTRIGFFTEEIDDDTEKALRSRNEPLIDLAIARFTKSGNGAEILFTRARHAEPTDAHARAVRLAALSNQVIGGSFDRIPGALFSEGEEGVVAWLSGAELPELSALFQNPRIDKCFLREFLEQSAPWQALDEDRLVHAMYSLVRNPRMRAEYDGDMDGLSEYNHNSVFHVAWKLAETVPVTPRWASILGHILNGMPEGSAVKDPLTIAERWRAPADDKDAAEEETKYEKGGYLSNYQLVRSALAKADIDGRRGRAERFLSSEDPAFRAAAYSTMELSVEQIKAGFERDKNLAVNLCQRNDWLWRDAEKRRALHDVSWAILDFNDSHMDSANTFNYLEEQQKLKNPSWFSEAELVEQAELPPTKADISAVIEAGERTREAWLEPIATALVAMNKRVSVIWWFSLGALVASVWRLM